MKFSNMLISYCIFGLFINLFLMAYISGSEVYDITSDSDVGSQLNDLQLIDTMQTFADGLHSITNPAGFLDIIGGLLSLAIGVLKGLAAVWLTPIQILGIITGTYVNIPSIITVFITGIMYIYIGFIMVKAYTGQEH